MSIIIYIYHVHHKNRFSGQISQSVRYVHSCLENSILSKMSAKNQSHWFLIYHAIPWLSARQSKAWFVSKFNNQWFLTWVIATNNWTIIDISLWLYDHNLEHYAGTVQPWPAQPNHVDHVELQYYLIEALLNTSKK